MRLSNRAKAQKSMASIQMHQCFFLFLRAHKFLSCATNLNIFYSNASIERRQYMVPQILELPHLFVGRFPDFFIQPKLPFGTEVKMGRIFYPAQIAFSSMPDSKFEFPRGRPSASSHPWTKEAKPATPASRSRPARKVSVPGQKWFCCCVMI